jgi:hypothetical protein
MVESNSKAKTYLVVGFSQNGKTSLINALTKCDADRGETGKPGQGLSCTSEMRAYSCQNPNILDNQIFFLIDTVGLGDTLLKSKRELQDALVKTLGAWNVTSVDGIIVPDAAVNSTTTLPLVHSFLAGIFGKDVQKSMLAVITKSNAVKIKDELRARVATIKGLTEKLGVKGPAIITTSYQHLPKDTILNYDEQFTELNEGLRDLKVINTEEKFRKITETIEKIAKEIEKAETIMEKVEYDESYVEMEKKMVKKEVPDGGWNLSLGFISVGENKTKTIEEEQEVPTQKTRKGEKEIEKKPSWEYCMNKARSQYLEEVKNDVQSLLNAA